jgi:DnaK suppressor protein
MTLPHDEIEHFRRELEAKRDDLAEHRNPDGIAIERTPDSMDELVLANERELTVERLNRETVLLRQVADALNRIATGEYGICLECEDTIAARRLTALPWAARCLSCQEAADREPREQTTARHSSTIAEAA